MAGVMGSSSLHETAAIVQTAAALQPSSVIDLGCGTGKYGFLLREHLDLAAGRLGRDQWLVRIDAVEGYAPYVTELHRTIYDEIVVSDIGRHVAETSERYELALALDVIEHFTPSDAASFMKGALAIAENLIVSTPRGYYRQEGHTNQLERHLSWWPAAELQTLADSAGARIAVRRDRFATIALFSCVGHPKIVAPPFWRDVLTESRSRLVPEVIWCRVRGKSGPRFSVS